MGGVTATLRNCQRGIIFLTFIPIVIILITVLLKLIKNRIDKSSEADEEGGKKYEESKNQKPGQTTQQLDKIPKAAESEESDDSTPFDKFLKAVSDFQVMYLPIFLVFVINLLMGTSFAFCIVVFFLYFISILVFNILKLHHGFVESKIPRLLLQSISYFAIFLWFLNQWTIISATDPYYLLES